MSLLIPEKCKPCMHRLRDYCKANKVKIEIIEVDKCNRKKILSRKEKRKLRHDGITTYKRCDK